MPFEVQFSRGYKATFFDLDEVPEDLIPESAQKRIQNPGIVDIIKRTYWTKLRNRNDFKFSTRGIRRDVDQELMFVGGLEVKNQKILMKNPRIVLGSDRMELYEFMARRKEVWADQNRSWLKLAIGVTVAHFVLVEIPQLSSRFFGDKVDQVSSGVFGAQDQSLLQQKLEMAK